MEDLQELVRQQRKRFGVPVEEQISETWENTSLSPGPTTLDFLGR